MTPGEPTPPTAPPAGTEPLDGDAGSPAPPPRKGGTARGAITAVLVAAVLCVVIVGDSIKPTGESMPPGTARSVVLAVGEPAGAIARALPLAAGFDAIEGWFDADENAPKPAAGSTARAVVVAGGGGRVQPEEFDRRTVQTPGDDKPELLKRLLVTGDSMSMPLDAHVARRLAPRGVAVTRDPRVGSGISKLFPVDWVANAAEQGVATHPQAVIVFLGANEGFPLPWNGRDVDCCTAQWAAAYAGRVRRMIDGWLAGGADHVFWLALPAPRDAKRQTVSRAVNAAVRAALTRYGGHAEMIVTDELFTPGFAWRSTMTVDGREQLVRRDDGIHLNDVGAELAAQRVEGELGSLYTIPNG